MDRLNSASRRTQENTVTEWIQGLIESWGAAGVALLMFLENLFPPIPSEVVLPIAGYQASQGHLSLPAAVLAGTAGSLAGVTLWYLAGRWLGTGRLKRFARRHGRWLTLTPDDIDKVGEWFGHHGGKAVLVGRMVPGVRTLISIPAGVTGMSPLRFLVLSGVGTAVWSSGLIVAGHALGERFDEVETYLGPVGNAVIAGVVVYYLYRLATFRRRVAKV
jgi:membrane protein DedA with SNARE-associated domain